MILVDPRTGSADLYPIIRSLCPAELRKLDSGDVAFVGNGPNKSDVMVGIERKRLGDALQVWQDGRLAASQLQRMAEEYHFSFLVVEGDVRVDQSGYLQYKVSKKDKSGRWSEFWRDATFGKSKRVLYVNFQRWLLSLDLLGGLKVVKTRNAEETARFAHAVHGWFTEKDWNDHKSLRTFDDSGAPALVIPTVAMGAIRQFAPGIGWVRATAAAEHFGTVEAAVRATEDEWQQVEGIDKILAARIVAGIRERHITRTRKRKRL